MELETSHFAGQSVCVTGAGGYIGSALVSRLAHFNCDRVLAIDASEQNLFNLQRRMAAEKIEFVLGNVSDAGLINDVFARYQPRIVFHAAAHKHVELLEHNPFAAISNNTLCTYSLARQALEHSVNKFVLVSTDKAAYPHSIMGASKRIAELLILAMNSRCFRVSAVRLCNVLGSTGSVVPLLLEQLQNNQPLTITDSEASRYFVSIDQAVDAIFSAANSCQHGTVLLPETKVAKRIKDLAKSLANGKPHQLLFTGLRPGEKLHEDLIGPHDDRILSFEECDWAAAQLAACIDKRDLPRLLEIVSKLVPDYVPSSILAGEAAVAR